MWDALRATVSKHLQDIVSLTVLIIVGYLIFQPMMLHWQTIGDYPVHNDLARQLIATPADFFANTPHFLYHVATAGLLVITPLTSIDVAAAWVMTLSHIALIVMFYYLLKPEDDRANTAVLALFRVAVSIALVIIMPINFFTPENLYFGYFAPIVYHNPTINMMKPFSVVLFFMALTLFMNSRPLSNRWIIPFALMTFLSLVAKPSFIMAFVPALGLLCLGLILIRWRDIFQVVRNPILIIKVFTKPSALKTDETPQILRPSYVNWSVLIGGIVLPTFAILAYQAATWTSSGGIGIDPFRVLQEWTFHYEDQADQNIAFKFIMSCAFPLLVYGLHIRDTYKNIMFNLGWLLYIVSALYLYLFVDYTIIAAGDFGWSVQVGALLLYVVAAIYITRIYYPKIAARDVNRLDLLVMLVCAVVFVLHIVAGVHWYRLHFTQPILDLIYIWW